MYPAPSDEEGWPMGHDDAQQRAALIVLDPAGHVCAWNQGAERLFLYDHREIAGQPYARFHLPAAVLADAPQQDLQRAQGHGRHSGAGWLLRRDGTRFWAQITIVAQRSPPNRVHSFALLVQPRADRPAPPAPQDTTATSVDAQTLAELTQQREHMRALALRLGEAEEAERRVLARELHDRVGANLTALILNLHLVRAQLAADPAAAVAARLDDSSRLASELMSQVRDITMELRPAVLDDYGLLAALRWLAENMLRRANLAATIVGADPAPPLSNIVQTALFRIAQEALNNAIKHARATQITIYLAARGDSVRLTIADNGVGFDPQANRPSPTGGLGMTIMRERAQVVGGTTHIESVPGQGSLVIVEVPR